MYTSTPHAQPAKYFSWSFLRSNELARDQNKRLFYTDASGETVPASDEDSDEVSGWGGGCLRGGGQAAIRAVSVGRVEGAGKRGGGCDE